MGGMGEEHDTALASGEIESVNVQWWLVLQRR
jgi:hypothetical protein